MYRRTVVTLIIFLLSCKILDSQVLNELPKNAMEAIIRLEYRPAAIQDMIVYQIDSTIYFPLSEILYTLKIYYEYNSEDEILGGYIGSKEKSFIVDFVEKKYTYMQKTNLLPDKSCFLTKLDVWCTEKFINQVFNLSCKLNMSKLAFYIYSKDDLPVMDEYKRYGKYSRLNDGSDDENYASLLYGRKRRLLSGGILDYSISGNTFKENQNMSFTSSTGLELLGGDLFLGYNGRYDDYRQNYKENSRFKWRYFFSDNSYLTQINTGSAISTSIPRLGGLRNEMIRGVSISNEASSMPEFFSNFSIAETINPGWDVELYKNGELWQHTTANNEGMYEFNVPINYGASKLELKYFGTKGEFTSSQLLYRIPNTYFRPGEILYNISAGERVYDSRRLADVRAGVGIVNNISFNAASRVYQDNREVQSYAGLDMRMTNEVNLSAGFSPNNFYKANIGYWSDGYGAYRAEFTKFYSQNEFNPSNANYSAQMNAGYSRFLSLPLNLSFNIQHTDFENYIYDKMTGNTSIYLYPFTFNFNYYAVYSQYKITSDNYYSHSISGGADYSWNKKPEFLDWLGSSRFMFGYTYDLNYYRFNSLRVSFFQYLFSGASFDFSCAKTYNSKNLTYNAGLRLDMNFVRSSSGVKVISDENAYYNQTFAGSFGFDPTQGSVFAVNPSKKTYIGGGGANIRLFLDENLNGSCDNGEYIIPDVRLIVPRGSLSRENPEITRVYNLRSYSRYNVIIYPESIDNPLWIPKFTEFSFIADPNSFKSIDIPCYPGGAIEGTIYRNDGKLKKALSGVRVHIESADGSFKKTVPVYSDGSYYAMGIPPGAYTVEVDSLQMNILGLKPEMNLLAFHIEGKRDGDILSNIDFDLRSDEYFAYTNNKDNIYDTKPSSPVPEPENVIDEIELDTKIGTDAPLLTKQETSVNKSMQKIAINDVKLLGFAGAKDIKLSASSLNYLESLAKFLNDNQNLSCAIIGHSDNFGTPDQNMQLSEKRAQAAALFLINKGIAKSRILTRGQGALYPISSNATPEGRQQNRRVEIRIIK